MVGECGFVLCAESFACIIRLSSARSPYFACKLRVQCMNRKRCCCIREELRRLRNSLPLAGLSRLKTTLRRNWALRLCIEDDVAAHSLWRPLHRVDAERWH